LYGGFCIAAAGLSVVFLLNAASFIGVIAVLYRWRRTHVRNYVPREHLAEALRAGVRYVRHSPRFSPVLMRVVVFSIFGSALCALFALATNPRISHLVYSAIAQTNRNSYRA
jgi:Transmembrane secretion effector